MTLKHGRTRYTRGCRCAVCKAAERDYQRNRYRRLRGLPVGSPDPPTLNVVESRRLSRKAVLWSRACVPNSTLLRPLSNVPALAAVALALAAILDNPRHIATKPAAARQLVAILGTLSKRTQPRGKLALVKSMTTSSPSA